MEQNAISEMAARHLRRAYDRIGIKIEIFSLPRKRALIAANRGDIDGVVARAAIITHEYKNLLQVPTPVAYLRIRAYGRQGAPKIATINDLIPYRIGYIRGVPLVEHHIKGLNSTAANTPSQLIHMLRIGRIDAILLAEKVAEEAMKKEKLQEIKAISGILTEAPLYHFLNRKHEGLLSAIDRALAATADPK